MPWVWTKRVIIGLKNEGSRVSSLVMLKTPLGTTTSWGLNKSCKVYNADSCNFIRDGTIFPYLGVRSIIAVMFFREQLKRAASLKEEDFVQLGKCWRPHMFTSLGYREALAVRHCPRKRHPPARL